jgi:DNA replication protein DnaC
MEARDERRLLRLQKQMAGHKLLIIDELGFVPLSNTGAELLFELISQRYERGSTLNTSNLRFHEGRKPSAPSASPARCSTG